MVSRTKANKPAETTIGSLLVRKKGYRQGRPCLRGTGLTVHAIAAAHLMGLTVEELWAQNPDLDRSLFYAALAYYYANKERIETELEADQREGEALLAKYPHGLGPNDPRD